MDGFAMGLLLLLGLLPLYYGLTAPPSTNPKGCAGPPVLCCSGKDSSCYRGCFCDEFCASFGDCCDDYSSTCTSTAVATAPPGGPSKESSGTTPAPGSTGSNTTASNRTSTSTPAPAATATTQMTLTESTTLGSSGTTSSPADGSTLGGVPNTNTDTTTTSSKEAFQPVTVHLTAYVLSHNGENEDAILRAFNKFLSQSIFQTGCNDCTVTIKQIKRT